MVTYHTRLFFRRWGAVAAAATAVVASAQYSGPQAEASPLTHLPAHASPVTRPQAAAALSAAQTGVWGAAQAVPGLVSLSNGGTAAINMVSCASPGDCGAGGYYYDPSGHRQAFVVSQVNGSWNTAMEVPGTGALNTGGDALVESVSCASPGNCLAGGHYLDASGWQGFVVSEVSGAWGTAEGVPGLAALNALGDATVSSVSCASPGNCGAGGYFTVTGGYQQVFVASEVNGTWGTAEEAPGTGAPNAGGEAQISSLSCESAGNCDAGGWYTDSSNATQAFVISEVNGIWGGAEQVSGLATLATGGLARINSVSCTSAGNCEAGGWYAGNSGWQTFVASETNGIWGGAAQVPGMATLNAGGDAQLLSVSCASAGNCEAGGFYTDSASHFQAFIASEVDGTWGNAGEVPGTEVLDTGGQAEIDSLSCPSAGNCGAGGYYVDSQRNLQAFVVSEANGSWGTAERVPGTSDVQTYSVSCASADTCSAGGGNLNAFVVSEMPAQSQSISFTGPGTGTYGGSAALTATGGGSGNPVVFSVGASSTLGACAVSGANGSTVTYTGTGSCVIDANQAGGDGYSPAPQVQQTITVGPAPLTVTASSATMVFGGKPPVITPAYSGFAAGDGPSSLTAQPACSTTAEPYSLPASYPSACSGAADPDYQISYRPGTVKVLALNYVAMGDSYSSGEGLPPFFYLNKNTGTPGDQCHRSPRSYPAIVASALPKIINQKSLTDVACSGATAANVLWGFPKNHENAQVGHLTSAANLVTISVGGDDVDFAGVLGLCVQRPGSGSSDCKNVTVDDPNGSGKKISLDQRETILISDLGLDRFCRKPGGYVDCQPSLHTLYETIASRAPRSLIIVMLYPHLFTNSPAPGGCNLATSAVHISQANITWLNLEADKLDAKIIAEAKLAQGHGTDIRWIDPRKAWGDTAGGASIGGHGVCTKQPWIYGPKIPLVYSFHPNSLGQAQFASQILIGKLTR